MKKKIYKIWGIGLALILAITLSIGVAAPAAAADYPENEWDTWGLPAVAPDTHVGPIAVADDGTIYAAVWDYDASVIAIKMSEDNGYTWDDTELDDLAISSDDAVAQIAVADDGMVYVGCYGGTVWRLEEGENPVALKTIVDSEGTAVSMLYSIDVWNDGEDNWIMAGTDLDCFVLQDALFEDWRDQEIVAPTATQDVYEVAFAPDFEDSELIWAVTWNEGGDSDFVLTATESPGQWGQVIADAEIDIDASAWIDIDFPDDYSSDPDDTPVVFMGLTSIDGGGVWMVECVEAPGASIETMLMDDENIVSLAVSGEVILAGAVETPTVYISDDLGAGWGDASKGPTGMYNGSAPWGPSYPGATFSWTHVAMAPGSFDPDDGVAYATTVGTQSAVSRTNDGGDTWNQVGLIDTEINNINYVGFHPNFPSTPTYILLTDSDDTYDLWVTENGDEVEPDYWRTLCGDYGPMYGNFDGEFDWVGYSPDGDTIWLSGWDAADYLVWKSTNDGNTFGSERMVGDGTDWVSDMAIVDAKTLICATQQGVKRTINSGLSWNEAETGTYWGEIALSPDYDNDSTLLVGSNNGDVGISFDGGASFDVETPTGYTSWTYVAFAPDFADGEGTIYVAGWVDNVQVGDEELDFEDLEDGDDDALSANAGEILVSEDNVVYVIDANQDGVARLLIGEDDNEWEAISDADMTNASWHAWLTPGSNVIWTIDWDDAELWVISDTLSGQVTLSSPADGFRADSEDTVSLAWNEMTGADDYELCYDDTCVMDLGTSKTLGNLDSGTEYEWKVRVQHDAPWSSRWSDSRTFHTALGAPPWAPDLYAPGNGATGVSLMPAFSWETAEDADGYQFQLNDTPVFATLVDVDVSTEAYQVTSELDYGTTYYWRVRALKGDDAISRWSEVSVFTTMEEAAPPPPAPTTTVVTTEAPPPVVLPTAIPPALLWTIIGIGAALIIAVIVLIVRTRRAV